MDEKDIAAATVELKGNEWGDVPVWTVAEAVPKAADGEAQQEPSWTIDVHATDEKDARAKALAAITPAATATLEERASAILEKLPPDRVVTASELLAIIRGA